MTEIPAVVQKAVTALRQEQEALATELALYSNNPVAGSPYISDNDRWKAAGRHTQFPHRRRLWEAAREYARLAAFSAEDHLLAVRRLLDAGDDLPPLWSHMSAGRIACEAAARVAYVLDSAANYEARLLRGAVMLYNDAENAAKAARTVPTELRQVIAPQVDAVLNRETKIKNRIAKAGISVVNNTNGKPTWLQIAGFGKLSLKVNITGLMQQAFAGHPGLYSYGSGVAHSSMWMLADAIVSPPNLPTKLAPDLLGYGAQAQACVAASGVVARTYAAYYGHTPEGEPKRETRLQAMTVFMREHMPAAAARIALRNSGD